MVVTSCPMSLCLWGEGYLPWKHRWQFRFIKPNWKSQKRANNWSKAILSATDHATAALITVDHTHYLCLMCIQQVFSLTIFNSPDNLCCRLQFFWLYYCCNNIFVEFVLFPYLESSQPDWSELLKHFYPGRENLAECKDKNWWPEKNRKKSDTHSNVLLTLPAICSTTWVEGPFPSSGVLVQLQPCEPIHLMEWTSICLHAVFDVWPKLFHPLTHNSGSPMRCWRPHTFNMFEFLDKSSWRFCLKQINYILWLIST